MRREINVAHGVSLSFDVGETNCSGRVGHEKIPLRQPLSVPFRYTSNYNSHWFSSSEKYFTQEYITENTLINW